MSFEGRTYRLAKGGCKGCAFEFLDGGIDPCRDDFQKCGAHRHWRETFGSRFRRELLAQIALEDPDPVSGLPRQFGEDNAAVRYENAVRTPFDIAVTITGRSPSAVGYLKDPADDLAHLPGAIFHEERGDI